jgi:hypothetical protein
LHFLEKTPIFVVNFKKMTTLEISISDESKVNLLLSLLKEFRFVKVKNIMQDSDNQQIGTLDINKFDTETQRRIADSIERHKNGDTSNLVEIGSIDELNKLFHAQ